ncbi:MAG TPA: dephospho-CoA kinase [Brumimicrobium sp.]|nr:dephospho-CoA kinase [Brumimicrobium sp.]
MIRVGITGGIGAGKTTVCKEIEKMGYPVFYSDDEAKKLMTDNAEVVQKITELFGKEAYVNRQLNRKHLAQQIFTNENLKEALNQIVHPAVRKAFVQWSETQTAEIVFNEAAILFETGQYKTFDYTVLVTAPSSIRIERVVKRDNTTPEEVQKRINNQWPDEKKIQFASFVIVNDGKREILPQTEEIIHKIKEKIQS